MRFLSVLLLPFAVACDDPLFGNDGDGRIYPPCPPGFVLGAEGCAFDEESVAELMRTFDDGSLLLANRVPFMQTMGSVLERNVWVSDVVGDKGQSALDLYLEIDPATDEPISAEFPLGTLIVHEAVNREEGHTVQVKLGDAWSDENGRDWWFGKYFDDGTPDAVPCSPCVACHTEEVRPNTDGLWGIPRHAL